MEDRVTYREAIALQPQALEASRKAVSVALDGADLAPLKTGSVALVGIGASLYAAYAGAAQMRTQGLRAFAMPGTELYDPAIDLADSYIALSASGRSVEPAKVLELRPHAATFGIATTADSPLGRIARTVIGTASGVDSGPNATSYVGSLQAVGLLADRVGKPGGARWEALPEYAEKLLESCKAPVERAAALFGDRISIDCVGQGVAYGTAGYISLMIREAARVPAQNWDTLNFLHGPMEPNDSRTGVILFGDGREVKLAQDLAGFGIPTVLVTGADVAEKDNLVVIPVPSTGSGLTDAILHSIPGQLLSADLAEAAGLPKCEFRYRQTDTKRDT
ncbi:glucosamine--fructose-6-phosphate aminotransferase (isomerizing) [Faunimonas pinastri]|uniref:Glutamine--fructose-6-phosphate aminotransferase [isomerizing] n=1 Tax=Faunimonas pinastri TaxID=1855383 RepID=A0A1H9CLH9_9HYPH|nr:phosphosugar isomerase [Faunimonas pinastri]SEQ02065.1 glucosamine--fructose-6-phosphate aminotransferase (isomerizing) [Faunimonas pinastri]